uniref:ATPase AAA-type core domain-containing protein n=1 Tax=Aegilops tauschii subsp. strangulata TaxID=200361 RepID=A0A453PUA9_AEGTS
MRGSSNSATWPTWIGQSWSPRSGSSAKRSHQSYWRRRWCRRPPVSWSTSGTSNGSSRKDARWPLASRRKRGGKWCSTRRAPRWPRWHACWSTLAAKASGAASGSSARRRAPPTSSARCITQRWRANGTSRRCPSRRDHRSRRRSGSRRGSAGVNRGILSSSVEVLSSAMTGATTHRPAPGMCNACVDGYERERADMQCADAASSLNPTEKTMSRWLQIGTPASARPQPIVGFQDKARDADELWRRWLDRCAQLHSHGRPSAVTCSEWNGASVIGSMQATLAVRPSAPARGTVVDTDLALGTPVPSTTPASASASAWDTDEKVLAKRLTEAVRWQPEAAAAVADTIVKARLGGGKRRRLGPKADTWVLFAGADMVGKRRMAEALSVAIFGAGPVTVRLGCATTGDVDGGEESVVSCRGRTALDRVAETVRANPFRVVVLDDLDHADDVVHGAIVHAIESGRLTDSHGRDVALGSAIFIVMSSWSSSASGQPTDSAWNLELRVRRRTTLKRRPEQELDGYRRVKPRKPLPLDLNLSMCDDHIDDGDEDSGSEGSRNSSSDLTVEHEQEYAQPPSAATRSAQSNVHELIRAVDGTVVFRSVDFGPLKRSVSDVVSAKFGDAAGSGGWSVHVDAGVLDRLAGAAWTAAGASTATATSLESWADEVLCPSIRQLKRSLSSSDVDGATTVSLSAVEGIGRRRMDGDVLFPTSVTVAVDGN